LRKSLEDLEEKIKEFLKKVDENEEYWKMVERNS